MQTCGVVCSFARDPVRMSAQVSSTDGRITAASGTHSSGTASAATVERVAVAGHLQSELRREADRAASVLLHVEIVPGERGGTRRDPSDRVPWSPGRERLVGSVAWQSRPSVLTES